MLVEAEVEAVAALPEVSVDDDKGAAALAAAVLAGYDFTLSFGSPRTSAG